MGICPQNGGIRNRVKRHKMLLKETRALGSSNVKQTLAEATRGKLRTHIDAELVPLNTRSAHRRVTDVTDVGDIGDASVTGDAWASRDRPGEAIRCRSAR